ncbi:unnamed protein product [Tenebrio molitor]|nr:unnamed protein product [Tenebrio molitor]
MENSTHDRRVEHCTLLGEHRIKLALREGSSYRNKKDKWKTIYFS